LATILLVRWSCLGKTLLSGTAEKGQGERLFQLACKRDLEGIVAKRKFDPCLLDGSAM
jgi:hypothetical protein